MSWDGEGRRPVRDKQDENRQLRHLMLSVLKTQDDVFQRLSRLNISSSLKDAFIEARRLEGNFKARRRIERHIVNLMRLAEEESLSELEQLIDEPERIKEAWQNSINHWVERLFHQQDAVREFVQSHPGIDVQHLRTLVRNARKTQHTGKTAPMAKLKAYLAEWVI